MEVVKIDRSTIRKNEDRKMAGTYPIGVGQKHIYFESSIIPNWINESLFDIHTAWESGDGPKTMYKGELKIEACMDNIDLITKFNEDGQKVDPEFSVTLTQDDPVTYTTGIDEPEYFYEYENTEVTCSSCGSKIPIQNVGEIEYPDGDGYYEGQNVVEVCPICKAEDSFDYEFERISEALKTKQE